ncbi:acyl-CoA dehydrogenase family protein [Gulosibacter bifidus]|uniref:Acyl-CoA dehydrogenase n=1 Tax=Gulosibacter bifidus TaxID=272239 RepID=A0ABW5RL31_9MICO
MVTDASTRLDDVELDADPKTAAINNSQIAYALMGSWPDATMRGRNIAADSRFWRDDTLGCEAHRERVLAQLRDLVSVGTPLLAFPEEFGGAADNGANLAVFQELFLADPSLQIKSGVQFGLFASAILHLGTETHHRRWLPGALSVEVPGAFAMTESGHGSNVAGLATTATYDEHTEEWVINTPFRLAWKDYLGNAAKDGTAAVVFAQLITRGMNHGVHAFYVPIRDENGEFLPGIGGEDDGVKGGLNGIDNGRLHFDHVRIPRDHLLNRYGDVDAAGTYTSPIESPGRRFFVMTGTLVQGRVSLDGAATVAQKAALSIGVTYANQRRQFDNAKSGRETVLLDYTRHQHRLIPRIATAYAATFAHDELLREFDAVFSGEHDTPERRSDLETLAAALKPLSTWQGMDTLQEVREACGGAGFLAENRIVGLHHDLDVYTTFEGDNNVLLQLVGKRLLDDFAAKFKDADARETARMVVTQTAARAFREIGLARLGGLATDLGNPARSVGWLREPDNQRALLAARVEDEIAEIGTYLARFVKKTPAERADALNSQQDRLIRAARCYAELIQWEAFTRKLESFDATTDDHKVMCWLRDLYGLGLINRDLDWYLLSGRLTVKRARLVGSYIDRLVSRLRPLAQQLVDAFGYGPEHLRAVIASGAEQQWQDEAHAHYEQLRASGQMPKPEPRPKRR